MKGKNKAAGNYQYNTDDVLGSGTWGSVYKAEHKFHKEKLYALKKMNKFKV